MNCPYCNNLCEANTLFEFNCIEIDHSFQYSKSRPSIWYFHHLPTDLFLNTEGLGYNTDSPDVYSIIKFEKRLRPSSAIKYLRKALKLASFL
jgi:hypothetical protein